MSQAPYDYLFDIGNVILRFDFARFARAVAPRSQFSVEEILNLTNDPKEEMEANKLDTEAFLQMAMERLDYQGTREEFIRSWQDIFELNVEVADLIAELKAAGRNLYLLSNTNQLHVDYFMNEYPVFEHFQDWVFSHLAGSSKPDPAIYQVAINQLGLDPAKTIYIDDLEKNIVAGDAAGFQSVHYIGQDLKQLPAFQL